MDLDRSYTLDESAISSLPYQWVLGLVTVLGVSFALFTPVAVVQGLLGLVAALVAGTAMILRRRTGSGLLSFDGVHLNIHTKGRSRQLSGADLVAGYRTGPLSFLVREGDGTQHDFTLGGVHPPATVDEILGALGLGVGQRAITVPLRPMIGPMVSAILLLFPLGIAGSWVTEGVHHVVSPSSPLLSIFIVAFVWLALLLFAALGGRRLGIPDLVVGDDGVRIRGAFRTHLVRYDSLQSVASIQQPPFAPLGITLVGKDGEQRTLAMYGQSAERIDGVVGRITEAIEAVGRRRTEIAASLGRGSRTIADWRAWLRTTATASGGFRDVTLPIESLEALLADPTASLEERVGAAIALRESGMQPPANVQTRIRVAAEASADPRVRVALDAAADDEIDEAALDKALH